MSSVIGKSFSKRNYDIPLNNDSGVRFLIILISMMCFLAILSVTGGTIMYAISKYWTAGLESKMTVEIPAKDVKGNIIASEDMAKISKMVEKELEKFSAIKKAKALNNDDIKELVSPWLGNNKELPSSIPLPGLISVEIDENISDNEMEAITKHIAKIAPNAKIDRHEEWLNDLLRFTGALEYASMILIITIAFTTITAVAGAIKSRMSVHKDEIELLHLMGASDNYIIRQFQRHSAIIGIKSVLIGSFIAVIVIPALGFMAGSLGLSVVPNFSLPKFGFYMIILTPVIILAIVIITSRITCKGVLREML